MQRHVNVYAVITIATVIISLFVGWSCWSGYRISTSPAQIRVLLDVRVLAAESHIFLEEYLSGDDSETPNEITGYLDQASALLSALEGRPQHGEARVEHLSDPAQRMLLETARRQLDELVSLTRLRLEHRQTGAAGSEEDQLFDAAFESFLASSKALEDSIHSASSRALYRLIVTQLVVALLVLVTFAWLYRLLQVRDRREARIRADIERAHAEVITSREQMEQINHRQNAMLTLSRKVQSAIGVEQFSSILLEALCDHIQAMAGLVWLDRGRHGLRNVASRCTSFNQERATELAPGEGMVGQVALSGQASSYALPPDYLTLATGSLSMPPSHTLLLPVCYQGKTVAVFEFAFLQAPENSRIELVTEVLESLAVRYFMFSSRENPDASPLAPQKSTPTVPA